MWWVLLGSVAGLAASSLMMVYWFSRLRSAIAERGGWKYTSWLGALPWILVLFNSAHMLLRQLTVIQKGGMVDTALLYTLATVDWIILATVGIGIILDAVMRGTNL